MSSRVRAKIRQRAEKIRASLAASLPPETRIYLSTGLESDFSLPAAARLAIFLRRITGYAIVHNPLAANRVLSFGLHELHDTRHRCGKGGIFVNDGTDISFPHRRSKYRNAISLSELSATWERNRENNCSLQLFWWGAAQGRERPEFSEPRGRNFRIYPEDITLINRLIRRHYVASK